MPKPKKWSNLKGKFPAPPIELTPFMQRVLSRKDELTTVPMPELASQYQDLDDADDASNAAQKERNIEREALKRRILEELAKIKELAGTDAWISPDGKQKFSPKFTPRAGVEDFAKLEQWLIDTGQATMIEKYVPKLSTIVKEALDEKNALMIPIAQRSLLEPGAPGSMQPPPGVTVFLQTDVQATSSRHKSPTEDGDLTE